MKCTDNKLTIYFDGSPIRKDLACLGEKHQYTTSTTLSNPTYAWYLDSIHNPILSTNPSYTYTFDAQSHSLVLVVTSQGCGIQTDVQVKGRECPVCPVLCRSESAFIPRGELQSLIDDKGNIYSFQAQYFECGTGNFSVVKTIVDKIKSSAECQSESLKVTYLHNFTHPLCLLLTIQNSPIKFKYIKIDGVKYSFYTNNC